LISGAAGAASPRYAAKNYGVEVLGITISREQQSLARERCRGLPICIELMDYRSVRGRFDRVVSVGMFEHVGARNYPVFFRAREGQLWQLVLSKPARIGVYRAPR